MRPNQHFRTLWNIMLKTLMVYHLQPFFLQSANLGRVVHNIAQTKEATAVRQFLLGSANGFHHSETEACVVVDDNLHIFNFQL